MTPQRATERPWTTVVIPALDAGHTLEVQLSALDRQIGAPPFSVIVVDNGSSDDTATVATTFVAEHFDITLVCEPLRGINRARNAGIAAARDGVVLLCDADDEVHPEWLAAMTMSLDSGRWVAGRLDYVTFNDEITRAAWGVPELSGHVERDVYVDNTYGGNCGFTRRMWAELSGFDPRLSGSGGDENEFFMRAFAAGYRVRWVPTGLVSYRLRRGSRTIMRQRFRQGRNQVRLRTYPGGRLLPPAPTIARTLRSIAGLIVRSPVYVPFERRRGFWLATIALHAGRLAGHRRWSENADSSVGGSSAHEQ